MILKASCVTTRKRHTEREVKKNPPTSSVILSTNKNDVSSAKNTRGSRICRNFLERVTGPLWNDMMTACLALEMNDAK